MSQNDKVNQAKIIVVDDEPLNLQLLDEVLLDEGFCNVVYFSDSVAAFQHVENEPVDLILLDLKMPVMDGYTFMEKLNEINKPRPLVLVLTASADKDTYSKVLKANAEGIVSKPFDFDEVLESIDSIIMTSHLNG